MSTELEQIAFLKGAKSYPTGVFIKEAIEWAMSEGWKSPRVLLTFDFGENIWCMMVFRWGVAIPHYHISGRQAGTRVPPINGGCSKI